MAVLQDNLITTVYRAKCAVTILADRILKLQNNGEDTNCLFGKLNLLNRWIWVIESYNCEVFEEESDDPCLTEAQITELLGKVALLLKS